MTKKALILLLSAIGGAVVIGTTATVVTVVVVNNNKNKNKTTVEKPKEDKTYFVYDGNEKIYKIDESEFYNIVGNKQTNAGTYTVSVELKNDKYVWSDNTNETLTFSFVIDKASVEAPTVDTSLYEFEYDGTAKGYQIATSDQYTITGNRNIIPGSYTAVVALKDKNNYKWKNSDSNDLTYDYVIKGIELTENNITVNGLENKEYTGSELTQNISVVYDNRTLVLNHDYIFSYQNNINAGTAKVIIEGIGNYRGTVEKTFTITPKPLDAMMLVQIPDQDYTGNPITPVSLTDGNKALVEGTDYEVEYSNNVDAGTATFTVTGKGNYTSSFGSSFTIIQQQAAVDDIVVPYNLVYNGQAQALFNEPDYTGGTLMYSLDNGVTWSETIPTGTNAGSYTIKYKVFGDGIIADSETKDVTVEIAKADSTAQAPTAKTNLVYNGQAQALINAGQNTGGRWKYSLDGVDYSEELPVATNYSYSGYVVYYKFIGDENHTDITVNVFNVMINQATPTVTSLPQAISSSFDFDGDSHELITNGVVENGHFEYMIEGGDPFYTQDIPSATNSGTYVIHYMVVSDDENYGNIDTFTTTITVTINKLDIENAVVTLEAGPFVYQGSAIEPDVLSVVINGITVPTTDYTWTYQGNNAAGQAKVIISISDADSNFTGTVEKAFTIVDPVATPLEDDWVQNYTQSFEYNGNVQAPTITLNNGTADLSEGVDYSISISGNQIDAGTYTITISGIGSYGGELTRTYEITKVAPTATEPSAKTGLVYTGSALPLINAGSSDDGTWKYSLDGSTWIDTVPTGLDADDYTIYYKFVGDKNHTDIAPQHFDVNIDKADATVTEPTIKTGLAYTGSALPLINAGSSEGGHFQYKLENETNFTDTIPTGINAGTYKVYYQFVGDGNHNDISYSEPLTITIDKADATVTEPSAKTGLIYTGSDIVLINTGSSEDGTWKYSLDGSTWIDTAPTGLDADDYTVYYKFVGDANHNNIAPQQFDVNIAKADATAEAPAANELTYSGSAQNLVTAGANNGGEWQYKLGDNGIYSTTIPTGTDAGTHKVYFKFIGDGNHNNIAESYVTVTIAKLNISTATVTLDNDSIPYAYEPITPQVLSVVINDINISNTEYSISYQDNNAVGTAKVVITITNENGNFTGTCIKTFSITSPETIDLDDTMLQPYTSSFDYDGTNKVPTITLIDSGTTLVEGTHYTVAVSGSEQINAGTYTITITGLFPYVGELEVTYSIEKIDTTDTAPEKITTLEYNGSQQELITAGSTTYGTWKYKLNSGSYSTTIPSAANAGTYTVYYKFEGDANHKDIAEQSFEITISRTDATLIAASTPVENLVYTGSALKLMTTGNSHHGHYEYSTDGETWVTTIPTGTESGNYTVYYKFVGDTNHKDIAATSAVINIAKANPTVTEPEPKENLTYNGIERSLVVNYSSNHGTWMYKLNDGEYSDTVPTATNAGKYTIKYKFVGDANHKDIAEVTVEVEILKANSIVTNPTAINTLVYDGTMQSLITAGSSAHGDFLYSLDGENYSDVIPTGINAETYTIYYKFVADDNHISIDPQTLNVTIALADSGATVPAKETGLAYTGSAQALVEAGTNTNGHWEYKVDNGEYSDTVPSATNAKTYRVYYKFVADTNYKNIDEAYYDVEIAKVNCSYTTPTAKQNLIYNEASQELITAGTVVSGGEWQYKLGDDGEYSTSIPKGTNYGSYRIYYKLVADDNHNGINELSFVVTIGKATPTVTAPIVNPELTYTSDALDLIIAGSSEDGYYEYSTDGENYSSNIPQATVVGSYKVWYRFIPDSNHSTIANGSLTMSISKADPVVTAPTQAQGLVYNGELQDLIEAGTGTGGEWQYRIGTSGDFSTDIPQGENATTYTIYFRFVGDDNHNDVAVDSFAVTIDKKQSTYTLPAKNTGIIYSGSAQELITAGSSSDGSWKYKLDDGIYSTTIPTATNVGTYTVYYRFDGDSNHTSKDDFEEFTITISKATPIVTAPEAVDGLIYSGSAQELITAGSTTGGTLEYNLSGSEQWIQSLPKATAAGTYTIKYRVTGNANYESVAEQSLEVTIAKKTVAIPAQDETVFVYNGNEQTYQIASSSDYTISGTYAKTAAGSNNIGISLNNTANMEWSDGTTAQLIYEFVINRKEVTVTLVDQDADWTGSEPTPSSIAYTAIGVIGTDNLGVTIGKEAGTDAGDYQLIATINNNNYILANIPSGTFTINKVSPTSTATPAANNFTYDNNIHNLVTTGAATGGTYYYKLGDGEYSTTIPSAKDAGTYTVTYYIKGDNNHNDSAETEVTVTISKAEASYTKTATAKVLTYTSEAQELVNAATTSHGTVMYSSEENGTYTTTIPTGTLAGDYRVWYYIDGDGNHLDSAKDYVDVTIKKAEVVKPTASTTSYTYTGALITHTISTSDYYTITDNTGTNAGNYTATVSLNDTANYCWKESTYTPASVNDIEFEFEITPKTLTATMVTLSTDSNVYNGENQKPTVTVTDSTYLTASDYVLTNNGGTDVGEYTVTVEAQGNYTGSIEKTYSITKRAITITLTDQNSTYRTDGDYVVDQDAYTTGTGQLIDGDDLNVVITKANGVNVGDYTLTATITNDNYNPTFVNGTYSIIGQNIDIASATILLDGETTAPEYTYNGQTQTPTIVITSDDTDNGPGYELIEGQDYTISYNKTNKINSGSYTITITAMGNYFTGSTSITYTIVKKELTNYTITLSPISYNGQQQLPTLVSVIDNDLDSSVNNVTSSFEINTSASTKKINAGTDSSYIVKIRTRGSSQYQTITISQQYEIDACDINNCTFSTVYDVPFTENVATNGHFPEPTITLGSYDLVKNVDYELSYGDNNSIGTGTVTITGIGNFQLSKTIEFEIVDTPVTLTFDPNGGTLNDSTSSQNVTFNYPYDTALPTPTKDYYDFVGWSPVGYSNITFDADATLDMLVGYTSFEAQWTLHEYTITYGNVSGEETYGNPTTYTYETPTITLLGSSDPTFMGWYTDQECTEGNEITEIQYHSSGNKTVYAKWNIDVYDITYNTNGGSEITEHTTYTQSTSTFDLPTPTKDYYNFGGWYTNSSLTGTPVTQITQGESGDREFWAKWTPTTYYITYKNTGDYDNPNPETYTVETPTFALNPDTKGGNIFVGWFDAASGGNQITEIALGSHGNMNIYARFIPIPTTFEIEITHDLSGSTTDQAGTITNVSLGSKYVGDTITPTFTVNDTYTFLGWYDGETCISTNPSFTTTLTSTEKTYVAKVARYKLTITKNSDGGSIDPNESQYVRVGDQVTLTATTTLGGYVFCGWFKGTETTPVTTDYTYDVVMEDSDVRYTAKWSHVTITIINSDESSNNSVSSILGTNYVVGGTIDITATPASGYSFAGWYSGDTRLSLDFTYTYTFKATNESLYAKFTKNLIVVNQGLLEINVEDTPYFILSTGGNYGTYGTNNIMDEDGLVTYTATNRSDLMFVGWYEEGSTGITANNTTYSLISRNTTIKLAPGTYKTIYPIYITKLGANAIPGTLTPSVTGGNYSGDPMIVTPQESDSYEFTKYTIDGVDVESTDPRLDGNILSFTEDLDVTLSSANNYYNRIRITAVYTRTSALVKVGKLSGDTFIESSTAGFVTKTGNTYTPVAAAGYEFVKWQWQMADGSNDRGDITDQTMLDGNNLVLTSEDHEDYFAIFAPLTNIQYKVNYKLQNTDDDNYTTDHTVTFTNGTTDEQLTVTPGTITGAIFKDSSIVTKTIAGDGSTEFDLYFDRTTVTVNYQYNNGTSTGLTPVSQRYGSSPKANTVTGWTKTVAGWYTDPDLTNEFTGTITSTVTLYARWQGDIVLDENDVTNYTAYLAVKIDDTVASTAIANDENIVIPSYYNGLPITIVDVNNLMVNGKIYNKVTMPNNLEKVIYGQYNSSDITWIVLDTTDGYKLLSANIIGNTSKGNATATALTTIESATGITGMSLLSLEEFNTYKTNSYMATTSAWWLSTQGANVAMKYYVIANNTTTAQGVTSGPTYGIRPTITI